MIRKPVFRLAFILIFLTMLMAAISFQPSLASGVIPYSNLPGDTDSGNFSLTANGTPIRVVGYGSLQYARFSAVGTVNLSVNSLTAAINTCKISPKALDAQYTLSNNKTNLSFSVEVGSKGSNILIRMLLNGATAGPTGETHLAIIINPVETYTPTIGASGVVDIKQYLTDADLQGNTDVTDKVNNAISNVPSNGTLYMRSGIYLHNSNFLIKNRTRPITIYMEQGVLIKRNDAVDISDTNPGDSGKAFVVRDSSNVIIQGAGVIDERNFQSMNNGFGDNDGASGIACYDSTNITINNVLIRNCGNKHLLFNDCVGVNINDVSAITPREYCPVWNDGMMIMTSQNVTADTCFTYGRDDCVSIYSSDVNIGTLDIANVTIVNGLAYTHRGNAVNINYPTWNNCYNAQNISVNNCDFIRQPYEAVMPNSFISVSPHDVAGKKYNTIRFNNCWFEEGNILSSLINVKGEMINGFEVNNCNFDISKPVIFQGISGSRTIDYVKLSNINLNGTLVKSLSALNATVQNVGDFDIQTGGDLVNTSNLSQYSSNLDPQFGVDGISDGNNATFIQGNDGGDVWTVYTFPTPKNITSAGILSDNINYGVGTWSVQYTTDGLTWHSLFGPQTVYSNNRVRQYFDVKDVTAVKLICSPIENSRVQIYGFECFGN